MKRTWFEMRAAAQQPAEIGIFDDIGSYGVTAKDFIGELRNIAAPVIHLSINSPGGSVFDALAMYNALRQHPAEILVDVKGVAASAASLVAMAGDHIVMPENAFMMIHNPWSVAAGNADDLRELADTLDKIGASLVGVYANRTGQAVEKIQELLPAETGLTASEAKALGFADEVLEAMPIAARFDLERMPEAVRTLWAKLAPPAAAPVAAPVPVVAALQRELDFKAVEDYLIAYAKKNGITLAAGFPLISETHAEITAVCKAAGIPEMAEMAIQAGVPLAALRHSLMSFRAAQDAAIDVNHHIPANDGGSLASRVWNSRRGRK